MSQCECFLGRKSHHEGELWGTIENRLDRAEACWILEGARLAELP